MIGAKKVDSDSRHSRLIATPVKTGVRPHPLNLDTVSQRYDRCGPPPGFRLPPE